LLVMVLPHNPNVSGFKPSPMADFSAQAFQPFFRITDCSASLLPLPRLKSAASFVREQTCYPTFRFIYRWTCG
jgi:hypothetical protein